MKCRLSLRCCGSDYASFMCYLITKLSISILRKAIKKLYLMHFKNSWDNDKNWGLQWKISFLLMTAAPLAPVKSSPKETERGLEFGCSTLQAGFEEPCHGLVLSNLALQSNLNSAFFPLAIICSLQFILWGYRAHPWLTQISVTIILEKLYFLYLISSSVDVVFLLPIHKKK